jgi:hypothetical protein
MAVYLTYNVLSAANQSYPDTLPPTKRGPYKGILIKHEKYER